MASRDLLYGFGSGNYGVYVETEHDLSILLRWSDVLKGRKSGIQVWIDRKVRIRDHYNLFEHRKQSSESLLKLLSFLFEEVYGDTLQSLHLVCSYYRELSKQKQSLLCKAEKEITTISLPVLSGEKYDRFISIVDATFQQAIEQCYFSFSSFGQALLSRDKISDLTLMYQHQLPTHYKFMKNMYDIPKKEAMIWRQHLKVTGYYDRFLFFQFLSQSRVKNSQNLIRWAIVTTAATYARGLGDGSRTNSSFFWVIMLYENIPTNCSTIW